METNDATILVRVPQAVKKEIMRLAAEEGRSQSAQVKWLLKRALAVTKKAGTR